MSTTQVGICVMDGNTGELLSCGDFNFRTYSESNFVHNMKALAQTLSTRISKAKNYDCVMVGIELANFKNPKLTNRFSLYAGATLMYLIRNVFINLPEDKLEIKLFNSSKWQPFVGVVNGVTQRPECKALARKFAKQHCDKYNESWSEDMCDAFCITMNLANIKSNEIAIQDVKTNKSIKIKKMQETNKIQKMIMSRQNKLAKLDVVTNKKYFDKINGEINNLIKYGVIKHES